VVEPHGLTAVAPLFSGSRRGAEPCTVQNPNEVSGSWTGAGVNRKGDRLDMRMQKKFDLKRLKFDTHGLIPAVIQDYKTKEVLMLAYMNRESLRRTIKQGKTCFWSRSRKVYWVKGSTSGNYQFVKSIAYDCDLDALLLKVRQEGVACHTGKRSCFYRKISDK
jgi:phosphoribosyl-AMP cyclohydrolase